MGHVPPFSLQAPSWRIVGILPRILCDADSWLISRRAQPPLGLHKVTLLEESVKLPIGASWPCFVYDNFFSLRHQ